MGADRSAAAGEEYPDFGPTLAAEKLAEREGIAVSAETVRGMQSAPACGVRRSAGKRGCFGCVSGGPGLAS